MRGERNGHKKVYRQSAQTGDYLIEVSLDRYEDVFNEWDPAPFSRRDIDPDLRTYIEECCSDLPPRLPIALMFSAPQAERDPDKERRVVEGLRTFIEFETKLCRRRLRRINRRTLVHLLVSLGLLVAVEVLPQLPIPLPVGVVFREGVTIGAWVFMWESISGFFFRKRDVATQMSMLRQLSRADILFDYLG
jgi:hypothetical protein